LCLISIIQLFFILFDEFELGGLRELLINFLILSDPIL
jgi:hypothetical protein